MFSVTVRTHMMVAHSLPAEYFGPAQALHGATYVCDAEFRSPHLNEYNVVIDIGAAETMVRGVVDRLNYKNLDELFPGVLTTTEFLAKWVHGALSERLAGTFTGELKVTLHESHVASASYLAPV